MKEKTSILPFILNFIDSNQKAPCKKPDATRKFHEYGISLTGLCQALNETFQTNLNPTILFAYPTPRRLADYLADPNTNSASLARYVEKEPVAIVGMSCCLPGQVNSPESYWQLLAAGVDAITEVPASRWDLDRYYDRDPSTMNKMQTRFGGFVDAPEQFDAAFFNISPKEAMEMDPQQRLFLRLCWEALEHANIPPDSLFATRTGVILGISMNDYEMLKVRHLKQRVRNPYYNTGRHLSVAAGRVAYFLGLHGPSYAVDAACASSLVAVHQGVKLIQHHEADCMLVGGVNLLFDPDNSIGYDKAKMLSPDGRCKPFDKSANGYVRSEACAVLVLKSLSQAEADGDRILALIRGSAMNQDGSTNGLTAPSETAQAALIQTALWDANLLPEDISYIEAHGTGTSLGDPIEFNAIKQVFTPRNSPLYLGAVKGNIGHSEPAAGIVSLIKVVLAMQSQQIPPNLHFNQVNPLIDLAAIPAEVPIKLQPWQSKTRRYAGISSYSFMGTNAHVILQEAASIRKKECGELPEMQLFILSAKTKTSLRAMIQVYIAYLENTHDSLASICYTLALGRSHFDYRIGLIATDKISLIRSLKDCAIEKVAQVSFNEEALYCATKPSDLLQAYLAGKPIDWLSYYAPYAKYLEKCVLPGYCFEHKTYWLDFGDRNLIDGRAGWSHPLLGICHTPQSRVLHFINHLDGKNFAYLKEHRVHESTVFPGAGFVELAQACGKLAFGAAPFVVKDLFLQAALSFDKGFDIELSFDVEKGSGVLYAKHDLATKWLPYAAFELEGSAVLSKTVVRSSLQEGLVEVAPSIAYAQFRNLGLDYGEAFQTIRQAFVGPGRVLLRLETSAVTGGYVMHPSLLDGAFQGVFLCLDEANKTCYVPSSITRVICHKALGKKCFAEVRIVNMEAHLIETAINFFDEAGVLSAQVSGLMLRALSKVNLEAQWLKNESSVARHEQILLAEQQEQTLSGRQEGTSDWVNQLRRSEENQRKGLIEAELKLLLAEVLNIPKEEIESDKDFFDLGMDSLSSGEFMNLLQAKLGSALVIQNTMAFDYGTVQDLVEYLMEGLVFQAIDQIQRKALERRSGPWPDMISN